MPTTTGPLLLPVQQADAIKREGKPCVSLTWMLTAVNLIAQRHPRERDHAAAPGEDPHALRRPSGVDATRRKPAYRPLEGQEQSPAQEALVTGREWSSLGYHSSLAGLY